MVGALFEIDFIYSVLVEFVANSEQLGVMIKSV